MSRLMKLLWGFLLLLPLVVQAESRPAPDFTLKNAAGEPVSLKDFRGKVVVLHFWATWCPYCKRLQPGLETLYQTYKEQGLEVLAVSFNEDADADPQASLDKRGMTFNTLIKGGLVARQYQVSGTPTTFFIDRKGHLRAVTMTSNPKEPGLDKFAQSLLAEK